MKRYPQVLMNVKVREEGKTQYENDSAITNLISKIENKEIRENLVNNFKERMV